MDLFPFTNGIRGPDLDPDAMKRLTEAVASLLRIHAAPPLGITWSGGSPLIYLSERQGTRWLYLTNPVPNANYLYELKTESWDNAVPMVGTDGLLVWGVLPLADMSKTYRLPATGLGGDKMLLVGTYLGTALGPTAGDARDVYMLDVNSAPTRKYGKITASTVFGSNAHRWHYDVTYEDGTTDTGVLNGVEVPNTNADGPQGAGYTTTTSSPAIQMAPVTTGTWHWFKRFYSTDDSADVTMFSYGNAPTVSC